VHCSTASAADSLRDVNGRRVQAQPHPGSCSRTIALRNHAGFAAANAFKNISRELSQNCTALQPCKTTVVQGINLRAVTRQ